MKKVVVAIFLVAILTGLVLTGCGGVLDIPKTGTLTVNMNEQVSRTLVPTISMVPASYLVAGAGPGGATFSKALSSGLSVTIPSLAFGDWTVTVTAKNSSGEYIGTGSCDVAVLSNTSVTANVTVTPYVGLGSLDLTVNWPVGKVENPTVIGTLQSFAGDERSLLSTAFTYTSAKATGVLDNVSTGYHTLTLKFFDNGVRVPNSGAAPVVRIVKGQTTYGVYNYESLGTGSLGVLITPEMADALIVTVSGAAATKNLDQSLSLVAAVSNPPIGTVTYKWYVNGDWVADGAAFSFDDTWAVGSYRIDATAYSADGTRAGSSNVDVTVPPPPVLVVEGALAPIYFGVGINNKTVGGADYKIEYNSANNTYDFYLKPILPTQEPGRYVLKSLTVGIVDAENPTTYSTDITFGSSDGTVPAGPKLVVNGDGTYTYSLDATDLSGKNLGVLFMVNIREDNARDCQRWIGVVPMAIANDWSWNGNMGWDFSNRFQFTVSAE